MHRRLRAAAIDLPFDGCVFLENQGERGWLGSPVMQAWFSWPSLLAAALLLSACGGIRRDGPPSEAPRELGTVQTLFDAATAIQDQWEHMALKGRTEYRLAAVDDRIAIRAVGQKSASGLVRVIDLDPERCPTIEWSWRVTQIQSDADLNVKEGDDVAASIFLLFGDPGLLSMPDPVPTLRYVWTNDRYPPGTVIDNPYLPGTVRNIVVRSGSAALGQWITERRNLLEDFQRAFGRMPSETVHALVLFTDNDQTGQPVEAYYGWAHALCGTEDRKEGV